MSHTLAVSLYCSYSQLQFVSLRSLSLGSAFDFASRLSQIAAIAVAGALVLLAAIFLIVRSVRRSRRARRAHFSGASWNARSKEMPYGVAGTSSAAARGYDEDLVGAGVGAGGGEKDDAYAMGNVVPSLPPQTQQFYGAAAAAPMAAAAGGAYYNDPTNAYAHGQQQQQQQPFSTAAAATTTAGAAGIADGKMAKVKQGFVRSMEDELGELQSCYGTHTYSSAMIRPLNVLLTPCCACSL